MEDVRAYAAVFEHASDAVLLTSPDGPITAANPAACRLLRRSLEEICEVGRAGLRDPDDPRWDAAVAERARTGSVRAELRMRRGDGTTVEVDLTSALYETEQGTRSAGHPGHTGGPADR